MDTDYYNKYQEPEIKIFKLYFKIIFEYDIFYSKPNCKRLQTRVQHNSLRGRGYFKAYVCYRNSTNAARHLNPMGETRVTHLSYTDEHRAARFSDGLVWHSSTLFNRNK